MSNTLEQIMVVIFLIICVILGMIIGIVEFFMLPDD